jgi:spore coat protein U-like protein
MVRHVKLAAVFLAALVATRAVATSQTTTFTVKAVVVKSCTVATAGTLDFGNYDPLSATDATASSSGISITCSKGTPVTVSALTTTNVFNLKSGTVSDSLPYQLFQDSSHTKNWSTQSLVLTSTSKGTALNFPVFGVIAAGADVTQAADYTDTVNVTVSF